MSGRTAREAMVSYRANLQRVVSCVTNSVVQGNIDSRSAGPDDIRAFALNNGVPVPLAGLTPLLIRIQQHFVVKHDVEVPSRRWSVQLVGYMYTVHSRDLTEVVAYQWHPQRTESLRYPHVHFGPASARPDSAVRPGELHKVHFPRGYVALGDVIRLVIEEFDAEPRRADWDAILSADRL